MARVKGGAVTRQRRRKVLKQAEGYMGAKSTLFKTAKQAVIRSEVYAYRDRKAKKRDFRKLWILRINAATRELGVNYSTFMKGLKDLNIDLNRKMLSEMAINEPKVFESIVKKVKKHLEAQKAN